MTAEERAQAIGGRINNGWAGTPDFKPGDILTVEGLDVTFTVPAIGVSHSEWSPRDAFFRVLNMGAGE